MLELEDEELSTGSAPKLSVLLCVDTANDCVNVNAIGLSASSNFDVVLYLKFVQCAPLA